MNAFRIEDNCLKFHYDAEELWVQPWSTNSFRVRTCKTAQMPCENWAFQMEAEDIVPQIIIQEDCAWIKNGKIQVKASQCGKPTFYGRNGEILLDEYLRNRLDVPADYCSALEVEAREFKPIPGRDYHLSMRFVSNPREKIFGMGQYQQPCLNLKGTDLELVQRNSQASVPFYVSSLNCGFLWNNPTVGRTMLGKNITTWETYSTKALGYWITTEDMPAKIEETYVRVADTVPMMPDYAMGFWQCKPRYQTQEELLQMAREYKKRNLPISVIVIDYFYWPLQGDRKFDLRYWPDPDAMIRELKEMGIELMASIWPTVDYRSENLQEMKEKGYLIRTDRGFRIAMDLQRNTVHFDATNPKAKEYVWQKTKQSYYDKDVKIFWPDEAESEYSIYDFDNYRYHMGPNMQIGNIYPAMYAKTFFDGMKAEGQENIINPLRCTWAGSQKYGALVWSGDIHPSFISLGSQVAAGLNVGMVGIPQQTTDIGGFHGGDPREPGFRELLIRQFEYGTSCPVMHLHGYREPPKEPMGMEGGTACVSGADNEVWSFGDETYEICKTYLNLGESMKPYIARQMTTAHEQGTLVMCPLLYDFPKDKMTWEIEDQYMSGPDVMVTLVLYTDMRKRTMYFPEGREWKYFFTGEMYHGGTTAQVEAPIDQLPVFIAV